MKTNRLRLLDALGSLLGCWLLAPDALAQLQFTNSATLTVALDGTNLLLRADFDTTNGAFTLLQADRPDALRLPPCACQISNQIFDLNWVPPERTRSWPLPHAPAGSTRFFRLLLEPVLSRGRALVFRDGPIDWEATRALYGSITNFWLWTGGGAIEGHTPPVMKQPEEVWLDHLGTYDTNGVLIGSNEGKLTSFYGTTKVWGMNEYIAEYSFLPSLTRISSASNHFHVDYTGASNGDPRASLVAASEVNFYWAINDYRTRFFNDAFIAELNLPPEIDANMRSRQYRPDLSMSGTVYANRPILWAEEQDAMLEVLWLYPQANHMTATIRSAYSHPSDTPLGFPLSAEELVSDFAGLMAFWILGTNTGFPPDTTWGGSGWENNVLPCLNDGLSSWVGYRYSGTAEWHKYTDYAVRRWNYRPCGGPTEIPCDKGYNVRNVMMYDESTLTGDNVFPFSTVPPGLTQRDGPRGSDRAALFFGAIFYDIANEAGLGLHKADLLIWKTISVISNNVSFTMRDFGAKVLEASRALWPDGRYTNDITDVLTSRGIPVNGVPDFRTNLPPAIGEFPATLEGNFTTKFGSLHPDSHPSPEFYGNYSWSTNGYRHPDTNVHYVAYQFYKHSKYGPCDRLALTDGTFTGTNTPPYGWTYNNDGTFYIELTDRELGNLVLMTPGRKIRWMRSRQRCPNEATGYYVEDVRPFGFRVIQAVSDGFSFTVQRLGETATNLQYRLSIVDPSEGLVAADVSRRTFPAAEGQRGLTSAATYDWSFTNYLGAVETATGPVAQYTAQKDEPFTLAITRTRGPTVDTLTWRERANDLDRNGGQAFVRNLVP